MSHRERTLQPVVERLEPRELLSTAPLGIRDLEASRDLFAPWQQSVGAAESRLDRLSSLAVEAGTAAGVSASGRMTGADVREAVVRQAEQLPESAIGQASPSRAAQGSPTALSGAERADRQAEREAIGRGETPIWQLISALPIDTVVEQVPGWRIGNQGEASSATTGLAVRARLGAQGGTFAPQGQSGLVQLRAGLISAANLGPTVPGVGGSDAQGAVVTLLVTAAMPIEDMTGVPGALGGALLDRFPPGSVLPEPLAPLAKDSVSRESGSSPTLPWTEAALSGLERGEAGYETSLDGILSLGSARVAMGINQLDSFLQRDSLPSDAGTVATSRDPGVYRGDFGTANDPGTWLRVALVDENADLRLPLRRRLPTIRQVGEDTRRDSEESPGVPDGARDQLSRPEIVATAKPSLRTLDIVLDDSEPATGGMIALAGSEAAGERHWRIEGAAHELPRGEATLERARHEPILIDGLCGRASAFEIEAAADAVDQVEDEHAPAPGGEASGSKTEGAEYLPADSAAMMTDTVLAPETSPVGAASAGCLAMTIVSGLLFATHRRAHPAGEP